MTENENNLNEVIAELADVELIRAKERRVLTQLLDKEGMQDRKYLAIRGMMGRTLAKSGRAISIPSYSVMHSLSWVATKNIFMGSEMDFMKTYMDKETGKLLINEESAEEMKQRAPDWSRQADLTTYLIQEPYHKFGTLLAVISPIWINDLKHENWGKDGRALVNAAKFEALDSEGNIGALDLSNVELYALDGQHRVMGIRGVLEVKEGGLTLKNKDGSEKKNSRIEKEVLLTKLNADIIDLSLLLNEKVNVEYIPAVIAGETQVEASRRIRSVFVAINGYAKNPDKGENILLQENDGHSIVGRRLGHHSIFIDHEKNSRVNWKNAQISKTEEQDIITLQALKACVEKYVVIYKRFDWKPLFKTVSLRPSDEELDLVESEIKEIFDLLMKLPVFVKLDSGDSLKELREFPDENHLDYQGHILLRPIGFPILFDAISHILINDKSNIKQIVDKLVKFDREQGFYAYKPDSIWYNITFDAEKEKMITSAGNQNLAAELLIYMLVGASSNKREELVASLVKSRTVAEGKWRDFYGNISDIDLSKIELPTPIKL